MKRVIIESPYAADTPDGIERNLRYLRACMVDCLRRGEAPFASHGLYTQPGVLDDSIPEERALGIKAGFAIGEVMELRAFYVDLGWADGMNKGLQEAMRLGQEIEIHMLGGEWEQR